MRRLLGTIILAGIIWIERARFTKLIPPIHITPNQQLLIVAVIAALVAVRVAWRYRRFFFVRSKPAYQPQPDIPAAKLSPADFEQETASVFAKQFQVRAEVSGKSGDGGIDVKLFDAVGNLWGIVQCKRYTPGKAISPMYLRDLDSCKRRLQIDRAWLVTTGNFSEQVQANARKWGIQLVDGSEFERMRQ